MTQGTAAFPPVPVTAEELGARWAIRDAEYAKQRLDPETVTNIRSARMAEAGRLPNKDERARMYARAQTWVAPVSQDYGDLKDWLRD